LKKEKMKIINFLIATFFGIGKIPLAPGTWASLAAAPCWYFLMDRPLVQVGALVGVFFLGVLTTGILEKSMGEKDPSCAVIDEVLGMGVALVGIPKEWPFIIMAVILFRIFDIWKPIPIRRLEKLPGGWGIMTDDLMAGLYANAWLRIGAWVILQIK
jgi:phosphatidylglycerophosphatase A